MTNAPSSFAYDLNVSWGIWPKPILLHPKSIPTWSRDYHPTECGHVESLLAMTMKTKDTDKLLWTTSKPEIWDTVMDESSRRPIIEGTTEDIAGGQKSVVTGCVMTSMPTNSPGYIHLLFSSLLTNPGQYTFCCSLPENILSLRPSSNLLTQKYIHFIQSTFTSVYTQPFA